MATLLHLDNLREGYIDLIEHITKTGHQVAPRGLPIIEVNDITFTVDDLEDTLPLGIGRDVNTNIAAVETLQLISGVSRSDLMVASSQQFINYREPNGEFYGAYGDRISNQSNFVLRKLRADRDSRQAVITLWNPLLDNKPGKRDYPCTVALGFRIRDDELDLSVLMRSNDIWLGVAYDVFQFTQLQWTLAHELDIPVGTYTHTAWSLHIYERDLPRCARLKYNPTFQFTNPTGVRSGPHGTYDEVAEELLTRPHVVMSAKDADPSLWWYRSRMVDVHQKLVEEDEIDDDTNLRS